MKLLRYTLLLILSAFLMMSALAQESYTFTHGPVLNLPDGWMIAGESDDFGNLVVSRPDDDFATVGMPPPAEIAPVLAEQGIDMGDSLEPLMSAIIESRLVSLEDGTLSVETFGESDVLIFDYVDESGKTTYMYLTQYANDQILLIELDFASEVDQAVLDDVGYMIENVEISDVPVLTSDDSETIETPDNLRLFTMRDDTMFSVPANWQLDEFTEEYGSYRFDVDGTDIRFELPSLETIEPALADLGLAEDEVVSGLIELNVTAEHYDTPFDPEQIEYTDIEGGQVGSYVSEQDGETLAVFIVQYENARLVALRVETMSAYSAEFDAIVRAVMETITFDGAPADYTMLSELVGDVEASVPEESEPDMLPTLASVDSDSYLETETYSFEDVNISFDYPSAWLLSPSSSGLEVRFDDLFTGAEIAIMMPVQEEIAPQLEAMGIDPESETLAIDMMQMLLATQDADGNLDIPPADDINTFMTDNATVASATEIDGDYTGHFYLLTFDNGNLALMNIAGADLPEALFDALIPLIESFDFGE